MHCFTSENDRKVNTYSVMYNKLFKSKDDVSREPMDARRRTRITVEVNA